MPEEIDFYKTLNLYRDRHCVVRCGKRGDGVYVEISDPYTGNGHTERFSCREVDLLVDALKNCATYLRASREIPN